jgi:hypothetical protein
MIEASCSKCRKEIDKQTSDDNLGYCNKCVED